MFKYFFSALFAAALWGFMSIPLKALSDWSSEDILYFRILVSTILIWPFIFIFRKKALFRDWRYTKALPKPERNRLLTGILLATALIMANWFTFIYAVNHISVQSAAFAYMVCPLLTTLAGYFILKEPLSRLKIIALLIAGFSVALLATGSFIEVMWSVSIGLFYAFYLILQRIMKHIDKLIMLSVQLTISSIVILPFLFLQGHPLPVVGVFWENITVIAVVFTIIPLYLSMYSLNGLPSSTMGILIYINPIITFLVAVFYFGEPITVDRLSAYGILLVAVVLFNVEFFVRKRDLTAARS